MVSLNRMEGGSRSPETRLTKRSLCCPEVEIANMGLKLLAPRMMKEGRNLTKSNEERSSRSSLK